MISAVVLAKNEEKQIKQCLESLSWCDEIIVIDDNSTDKTEEIAKKMGAKVYIHSLEGDFSQQRNFGLEKSKGDWVLFVDADEQISSALWYEIMQYVNEPIEAYSGFYLRRRDVMWGKKLLHGELGKIKLLRLAKKNVGKWEGKVHETWEITGKTLILQKELLHYPHQTIEEFLSEINFYTDIRSKELFNKKIKSSWWDILLFPLGKFIRGVLVEAGFLDGLEGLVFAFFMSFHSFLVRGKLWLLWQKK